MRKYYTDFNLSFEKRTLLHSLENILKKEEHNLILYITDD